MCNARVLVVTRGSKRAVIGGEVRHGRSDTFAVDLSGEVGRRRSPLARFKEDVSGMMR
jgi:hypothetical protein